MIPSIDAYLLNQLQMRSDLRRTPITELGCMAGAVALSRAWEQLSAYPNSRILVLSIELPSLTFQRHDPRPAQLISSMIFSDGAAAVVLSNKPAPRPSPWIIGSRTYTVAGTIQEMGYDLENDGLHIILSSKVPLLIRQHPAEGGGSAPASARAYAVGPEMVRDAPSGAQGAHGRRGGTRAQHRAAWRRVETFCGSMATCRPPRSCSSSPR